MNGERGQYMSSIHTILATVFDPRGTIFIIQPPVLRSKICSHMSSPCHIECTYVDNYIELNRQEACGSCVYHFTKTYNQLFNFLQRRLVVSLFGSPQINYACMIHDCWVMRYTLHRSVGICPDCWARNRIETRTVIWKIFCIKQIVYGDLVAHIVGVLIRVF